MLDGSDDPALQSAQEALREAEVRRARREMELLSLIGGSVPATPAPVAVPIPPPSPDPVISPSARAVRVADDFIRFNTATINGTYSAKPSPRDVMRSITSPARRTPPSSHAPTISSLRKRTPEADRTRSRTPQLLRNTATRNRKKHVSPQRSISLPGSGLHKELQKTVQRESVRENIHKDAAASAAARVNDVVTSAPYVAHSSRSIAQSSTSRATAGSPGRGGYSAVVSASTPRESHFTATETSPPTTPPAVIVSGAGRTFLNGIYYLCVPGVLDDVNILYRSENQTCSLYLKNGRWRLNDSSDTNGWIYSAITLVGQWQASGGGEGDIGYGYPKVCEPGESDVLSMGAQGGDVNNNNSAVVYSDVRHHSPPPPTSPRVLSSPVRSMSPVATPLPDKNTSVWASQEPSKTPNYAAVMLVTLLFLSILAGWSLHSFFTPPPTPPPPPPPKHEPFVHDGRVCTLSDGTLYCTEIPGAAKIDGSRIPNKQDVEVVAAQNKAEKCSNPSQE